jgi:CcmD family protein
MSALNYVGLAYLAIWIGVLVFVLRLASRSRELARRVEELERRRSA